MNHKDPTQKIISLMNTYHSIPLMDGTKEEKEWAQDRLSRQILGLANHISTQLKGDIQLSLKSREHWEATKNIIG